LTLGVAGSAKGKLRRRTSHPLPCASAVIGQAASRLCQFTMIMQNTVEYANNRVSPATIELLTRERNKGKSLRQLGQVFGRSHERIRQVLAKYGLPQEPLLSEKRVASKLGYPVKWLVKLRKEGIIEPVKYWGWRYSEEQVRQISSLIAQMRRCERCGKLRPPGSQKFCRKCSQYRRKHKYRTLSPEGKAKHMKSCLAWRKANPEKWKEIQARARRKHQAKAQRGIMSEV